MSILWDMMPTNKNVIKEIVLDGLKTIFMRQCLEKWKHHKRGDVHKERIITRKVISLKINWTSITCLTWEVL